MNREELVIGGFGGQGIILAGIIIGKAASIFDGKNATQCQNYGPEARGGACKAQVVISDSPISYPYIENPTLLTVMSQEAYDKFSPTLRKDALLIIDNVLVNLDSPVTDKIFSIPATQIAEDLGRVAVANIVMLGFLATVSNVVSIDALKKAVLDSVPEGTEELNLKAFESGYGYGIGQLKSAV